MRPISVLFLLAACSDYNLTGNPNPDGDGDSGDDFDPDDDTIDLGQCGEADLDRRDVGIDESCVAEAITGTFTPVIKWQQRAVGDTYVTPIVGQLTDDNGNGMLDSGDTPDVVASNGVGVTYALDGATGAVLWSSGNLGAEPMTPALGDLDGDGWTEVVGAGASGIQAYDGRTGAVKWSIGAYAGGHTPQCGAVGVYDLSGDGAAEVVIGHAAYDGATGSQLWNVNGVGDGAGHSWAAPMGVAADVDRDGKLEVVVGNALLGANGKIKWQNGKSDGFVAVANFDSDDYGEIVVAGEGNVRLQDDDGTVLWSRNGLTGSTTGAPTVADFDGDGEPEIGVAGMGQYVVLEGDGAVKWTRTTNDYSSGFTGSAVFDFEGDGAAEVVYADENDVFAFDGATGAVKMREASHSSATCSEYPSIADVDNDGHADIIYTSSAYSGSETGVTVITDADASWMAGRPVWNQHGYSITHIEDDGSIPAVPDVNWDSYNSFRSGDMAAAEGGLLTDAVPVLHDVCNDECDQGHLYITVSLGNMGMTTMPAGVPLTLYSEGAALATEYTTEELEPGEGSKGMVFDLDPELVGDVVSVKADVSDAGSVLAECNEDNNNLKIEKGLCK